MKAELLFRERIILGDEVFVELVVWRVPTPVRGSAHPFKYSLALVSAGECVLRYDNEAGKGDHKHISGQQETYRFVDMLTLQADFWSDVQTWMAARS